MGFVVKLLLVLLLASGVAYYLVPLLTVGTAQELRPAAPPTSRGADAPSGGSRIGGTGNLVSGLSRGRVDSVATVESTDRSRYSMLASGLVTSVPVKEGDRVTKGQVLVQLDQTDLRIAERANAQALADAEARILRTDFEMAQAEERLRNGLAAARDAEVEAAERLRQAELDQRHGAEKAEAAVRDATASIEQALAKLRRALHGFNRTRTLAKLAEVNEPAAGGQWVVPARPQSKGFDDTLIKYNDYIEAELSYREAILAHGLAAYAIEKATMARTQQSEASALAVGIAKARADRSKRDTATAQSSLDAQRKTAEFARAQVVSAKQSVLLEQEKLQNALAKTTVTVSEADDGSVIAELLVSARDHLTTGTLVAVLLNPNRLRARCHLSVDQMPLFQRLVEAAPGGKLRAAVTTQALDGALDEVGNRVPLVYGGSVTRWSAVINPSSTTYMVEVALERLPQGLEAGQAAAFALQPGMVVRISLGGE